MSEVVGLKPVDTVEITTLCENLVDSMAPSSEAVERRRASASNPVVSKLFAKELATPFEGAHGLSMLVRVTRNGITRSLLFDAGGSTDGLMHNLDCLELNPRDFSCIVLSHGHFDHVLGLVGLQQRLGRVAFPLTLHPDAYLERGARMPSGAITAIGAPSRQGLRDAGLELIEDSAPSFLLEKMALVTVRSRAPMTTRPAGPITWRFGTANGRPTLKSATTRGWCSTLKARGLWCCLAAATRASLIP
jgi:7,8-dihydropterin-6-yl-methyl-4-(beta-D-ribofuranosyl)aminobenzene 5'-phosphate synthase